MSKYSLKNIILGIGIGFILAAMVNINAGKQPMTVEEIKKEAEKHQLIVLTKDQVIKNQQNNQEKAPAVTPTATPDTEGEKVTIRIESGATSESVAGMLKAAGLIEDAVAFVERLKELDKTGALKAGEFTVRKGMNRDELINALTQS